MPVSQSKGNVTNGLPVDSITVVTAKPQRAHSLTLSSVATCILLLGLHFGSTALAEAEEMAQKAPEGYQYPSTDDLKVALFAAATLVVLRYLSQFVFRPVGEMVIPHKKKWSADARNARVERFSAVSFKFLYFCFATSSCWVIFSDADFFIPSFGGHGSEKMIWEGYPYQEILWGQKYWYLIQLGYHGHSLFYTVIMKHRGDFLEMSIHHLCTIFLVQMSFCYNFQRIGVIILFLHDVGDVFSYAIKMCADTNYTKVTLTLYVCLLISWGYMRLYVLPTEIIRSCWIGSRNTRPAWRLFANSLLWCLQVLHVYWYSLFLKMGYNYATKGTTEDIQDRIPNKKK